MADDDSSPVFAKTMAEQVAVDRTGPLHFRSRFNPDRMGNAMNIAYGGCALSAAVQAACQTVAEGYNLYSATGSMLSPATTDFRLDCAVRLLRDTRTFATRHVKVWQKQKDGGTCLVLILLADFHKSAGETSLMTYAAPPAATYPGPAACQPPLAIAAALVQQGVLPPSSIDTYTTLFGLMLRYCETRFAPNGVAAQNLNGMARHAPTTQDTLPLTARTSADWVRVLAPLAPQQAPPLDPRRFQQQPQGPARANQYAALSFIMDAYLSFVPLMHEGLFLHDAGAASTLEFALRIVSEDWDLNEYHLRELRTIAADAGRQYTESRLWSQDGKMVAVMTQQSILRPPKENVDSKAEKAKASL